MGKKHIFFDFDETLVFTSKVEPYRKTGSGKKFIVENPEAIETKECLPELPKLFNILAKHNMVSILTNSPKECTRSLLKKHGFNYQVPIFANQHKPCLDCSEIFNESSCRKEDAVLVGDSIIDLLTAKTLQIPSIAVTWGNVNNFEQLKKYQPSAFAKDCRELCDAIGKFNRGEILINNPIDDSAFIFCDPPTEVSICENELQIHYIDHYYPTGSMGFNFSISNEILRFKELKNYFAEEINGGVKNQFFYNGLKTGCAMKNYFWNFKNKLAEIIDSMDIVGSKYVIGAPNSLPELCYKSDINQLMANQLNKYIYGSDSYRKDRFLFRVFPKNPAHNGGDRKNESQFATLGVKKDFSYIKNYDNILIFDDVTTTGSQLRSIAYILRELCGYSGGIRGLTLGKTISYFDLSAYLSRVRQR